MRRFDVSPRRATPKGHNLHHLHSTALRRPPYIELLSALMAHTKPYLEYVRNVENGYVSVNFPARDADSMEISCRAAN